MKKLIIVLLAFASSVSNAQTFKIVFYDNCEKKLQDSIVSFVSDYFHTKTISGSKPFPTVLVRDSGFDAISLIHATLKHKPDSITRIIGITSKALFAAKDSRSSWGVFGYSMSNPGCAVVSTKTIQGKNLLDRIVKIIIHEITHTYGVEHCSSRCLMNPGNGYITELDSSPFAICEQCAAKARQWQWN